MWTLLIISLWFQMLWFCTVLGQTQWQWWSAGLLATTLVLTQKRQVARWHWWWQVAAAGLLLDSVNTLVGVFQFDGWLIPLWLALLWGAFAWYSWYLIPILASWPRPLQWLLSGVSGGLSYLAGAQWDAVVLPLGTMPSMGILMVEWALFIQYLLWRRQAKND